MHGHRGQHLVRAARQAFQHGDGFVDIGRLAEDLAVDGDGGVGRQHRTQRHAAQVQHFQANAPFSRATRAT
jgi:hypothetical protein